jgi:hypothetical protein
MIRSATRSIVRGAAVLWFSCLALGACGKSSAHDERGSDGTDSGGGGSGTGGGGSSGTPGTGGDAGTSGNRGIEHGYTPTPPCAPRAACGEGIECVELIAGGITRCVFMGGRPTATCSGDGRDECCESSECGEGSCYLVSHYPSGRCGLGGVDSYNECQVDECSDDSECPDGFCALGPRRTCLTAGCRGDADCTESPGGVCRALDLGCCTSSPGINDRTLATACVYPGDGCANDLDCPSGSFCTIVGGRAACRDACTPNVLAP